MAKDSLQQLGEDVKSQHEYMESLSPDERSSLIIQMHDAQSKNARQSMVFLAAIGLLFSAGTIYLWLIQYRMNLMSSLGIIGGALLAAFGFRYIQVNRIALHNKIQTNDFTDEDVIAYFREHEGINQRALEQWNKKGKYIVSVFGGLLMLLLVFRPTMPLAFLLLTSGISVFLVGLVVFTIVQKGRKQRG